MTSLVDDTPDAILALNARLRMCRRCELNGWLSSARPVALDGGRYGGIVLVGQAPGIVENESGRPFGGRAGKELFRWLAGIGITEPDFRRRVYMAAVTRCFPGKAISGSGDRRPSRAEIEACRPWLDAVLDVLKPTALLLVGQLAIEQLLGREPLSSIIGSQVTHDGRIVIPLPHPSGASRWLNVAENKILLSNALAHVQVLWAEQIAREW